MLFKSLTDLFCERYCYIYPYQHLLKHEVHHVSFQHYISTLLDRDLFNNQDDARNTPAVHQLVSQKDYRYEDG